MTGSRPGVSVITIAHERIPHLTNQVASLAPQLHAGDEYIVVQMGGTDPTPTVRTIAATTCARVIALEVDPLGSLPLAQARNTGATHAVNDRLIFLDIDCVAERDLVDAYLMALESAPDPAVWSGPVGYLGPDTTSRAHGDPVLIEAADFPPHRPQPGQAVQVGIDPSLFWSLSFACRRSTWQIIGGFDEGYVGYGGEDTDFAYRTHAAEVPLAFIGDAVAYHQHHPTSSPPWQHLGDICRNASRFKDRWGWWPMGGWLQAFADAGAIHWNPESDRIAQQQGEGPR